MWKTINGDVLDRTAAAECEKRLPRKWLLDIKHTVDKWTGNVKKYLQREVENLWMRKQLLSDMRDDTRMTTKVHSHHTPHRATGGRNTRPLGTVRVTNSLDSSTSVPKFPPLATPTPRAERQALQVSYAQWLSCVYSNSANMFWNLAYGRVLNKECVYTSHRS